MMPKPLDLTPILRTFYGADSFDIQILREGITADTFIYQIRRANAQDWIGRAIPANADDYAAASFMNMVTVLGFLSETDFPAERLVHTIVQEPLVDSQGWRVVMSEYAGATFMDADFRLVNRPSVDEYRTLGAMLGRLHSLPVDDTLPKATTLPEKDLEWLAVYMRELEPQVPAESRHDYAELVAAIASTDRLASLPTALIHHDCHLGNIARGEDSAFALIDWNGSGLGPAILDLSSLLTSCVDAEFRPHQETIAAVMTGYNQARPLADAEWALLPDAMRFRTLVLLGGYFPDYVSGRITDESDIYGLSYRQWWARYARLDELAEIAMDFT